MIDLLTTKDVCEKLKVSRMTLHRLVRRGSLPVVRLGRLLRFRADSIEQYLRKMET
jgi:excisionase family DNA binding protein